MSIVIYSIGIIILIFALLWFIGKDTHILKVKKGTVIDFKPALDLTGVPMITFYQGSEKFNFIVDTGSSVSYINKDAGIKVKLINGKKETFIGAGGADNNECSLGMAKLTRGSKEFNLKVRIADLNTAFDDFKETFGVHAHGLLGNDIMADHKYCIDFKEFIIYERK